MKMKMGLLPDMKKQASRSIEAEFPDDLSQEEFWNFVMLMGANVFGEETQRSEGEISSQWDILGSFILTNRGFQQWVKESQWLSDDNSIELERRNLDEETE